MEFEANSWYRLSTAASMGRQLSLAVPSLPGHQGNLTHDVPDNDKPTEQWQLFPVEPSTFMLRSKASGSNAYLTTRYSNESRAKAVPQIHDGLKTDNSMLWRVLPWDDGTFYFSNVANGKFYHLEFTEMGVVDMSPNTTQPQPGQAFSFVKAGKINDLAFSSVKTPLSSSLTSELPAISRPSDPTFSETFFTTSYVPTTIVTTFTYTTSASPTPTGSSPAASSLSHKLSPSAAMGVGVTIGALGVVFLTALGLFMCQQRMRRSTPKSLHYRRAKLWKGFTPQHRASNMSVVSKKTMSDVYVTELPELPTPSLVLSSPLSERHFSWQSWHTESPPFSPFAPTPTSPPIEMPV